MLLVVTSLLSAIVPVVPAGARAAQEGGDGRDGQDASFPESWFGEPEPSSPDDDPAPPPVEPVESAPPIEDEPTGELDRPTLPAPGTSRITLGAPGDQDQAGDSPVSVAAGSRAATGQELQVEILDQSLSQGAGLDGFAFRVTGPDGAAVGDEQLPVDLSIDYGALAEQFGGAYADRLQVVALPECALADPIPDGCSTAGTPLPTTNDREESRLVVDVGDLAAMEAVSQGPAEPAGPPAAAAGPAGGGAIFAVTAGSEGEEGSFKATPLSVSGDWEVGIGSGEFTYDFDIPLPEAPAGPTPEVTMSYSSGSVDGMVTSRNNQASPTGLGWGDFANAFVERRYNSCRNDGQAYDDLCWKSDNATISLNGRTSELVAVPGSGGAQWKLRDDPRWRVERLTGVSPGNGDDNGEHWKVTTPDGTEYFFGLGVDPDHTTTRTSSVWTTPVIGDDSGEPCNASFSCTQAWRWNLDRVIDPNGNEQLWLYEKETNNYGFLNGWNGNATPYDRSGHLREIQYGKREASTGVEAPSVQVYFTVWRRCTALNDSCPVPSPSTASQYPDVPVDLICTAAPCAETAPTFFSTVRYKSVHVSVRDPNTGAMRNVDGFDLGHAFQDTVPGTTTDAKLYLTQVQRVGHDGGEIHLPPVTFFPVSLPNRVDASGAAAMPHWRIAGISDEFGRGIFPAYGEPDPCPSPIPDPPNWHLNTRNCFPQLWSPPGGTARWNIFHKYLVTQVTESDGLGGGPEMVTRYTYGPDIAAGLPEAAWHHDRDEFVPQSAQTWSEWRGYQDVLVTQGATRTRYRVHRGMHGDRLVGDPFPGPGTRQARISSLDGTVSNITDDNWLRGRILDEVSLLADGTTVERGTVHRYQASVTANAPPPTPGGPEDPIDDARWVGENDTTERRRVPATGAYVRRRTQTTYNGLLFFPEQVIEHGWSDQSGDERCTRTDYVFDSSLWMLDYPYAETRYGNTTCTGTEHSRTETAYDHNSYGLPPRREGTAPRRSGNATATRVKIDGSTWAATVTEYDALGRPTVVTDPNLHNTTTAHTPATGFPATTTVTNHLGHVHRTNWYWQRQVPREEIDANGNKTSYTYDPVGRVVEVRQPTEQGGGSSPSWQFVYDVDPAKAKPPVVRTRQLQDHLGPGLSARYLETWVVYDSLLRERQTHTLSPAAGKVVVTDTRYDNRGLVAATSLPQGVDGSPGLGLLPTPSGGWANETTTAYDELSRPVWEVFWAKDASGTLQPERSTTTAYTHNTAEVTPARGGKVRRVLDAYDRTVRVEEHDGTAWRPTTYGYDPADRLTSVTDPANNQIGYVYDLAGRRTGMSDPDAGGRFYGYDLAGNQTAVFDGGGGSTHTSYDALNRPTFRRSGSPTGPLLASWQYDAAGQLGLLAESTRYTSWGEWEDDVVTYDGRNRPTSRRWEVPATVPGLGGSYLVSYAYDRADHVTAVGYEAGGGLPAELVTTSYNSVGLPETMSGLDQYVHAAGYDDRGRPGLFGFGPSSSPAMGKGWEYNRNQELSRVGASLGGSLVQDHRIAYDKAGNVTERNTSLAGQSWRECFGYDDRQRLTRAFTTSGTCASGSPGTGANPYDHTYSHSPDGNITRRVEGTGTPPIDYTYPPGGSGSTRPHAPTAVGGGTYTWDGNGNLRTRTVSGQTETFTWDAEHRLAGIDDPDGDSSFVYDADGNRLMRDGPTFRTLYIDGHEITATPGGVLTSAVRSYSFNDELIATRTALGVDYLATDNQGSVQLSVPAGASTPEVSRTYLPYGRRRSGGQPDTDRAWIGQIEDDATALTYLNDRYYDPNIARFLSPDPLYEQERPQTINPYSYGISNPTTNSDPTGMRACADSHCDDAASQEASARASFETYDVRLPERQQVNNAEEVPQEEIDEILRTATDLYGHEDEDLAMGVCGEYQLGFITAASGSACVLATKEDWGTVETLAAGFGTPVAAVSGGILMSNAQSLSDLEGRGVCMGAQVGTPVAVGATVCGGLNDDDEFTGTVIVMPSAGGALEPGGGGWIMYGETKVQSYGDTPGVVEWLLPDLPDEYMECACPQPSPRPPDEMV